MKIVLISLPWCSFERPSGALGALAGYIQREAPEVEIEAAHEYLHFASQIGFRLYEHFASDCYSIGEPLFQSLYYPERAEAVREVFREWIGRQKVNPDPSDFGSQFTDWNQVYDHLRATLNRHIDDALERAIGADLVGLTTCFGQLIGNVDLARRLKARDPNARVVLGGSTVSGRVGPSVLREYPFIDYIVQGEGEAPLLALIRDLQAGTPPRTPRPGLLVRPRDGEATEPVALLETGGIDALPLPDYDSYAAAAEQYNIDWILPIEGSRGCWWDRTKRSRNPKATCYFCNLNVQWNGYREKTTERLLAEVDELTDRYEVTRVFFLDNIIRHYGLDDFARGLAALGKDLDIFYEMRANVRPYQIMLLWEGGLRHAQFGIEALSSSLLKRMGKGTTTIQNLEVMKTCAELQITGGFNLIIEFPGSTQQEIAETLEVIDRYACTYEACGVSRFTSGVDSTVDVLRSEFGLRNVRNSDKLRPGFPDEVWQRLELFHMSFDPPEGAPDWDVLRAACDAWEARRAALKSPLLHYSDGKSYLRIFDTRSGESHYTLYGLARELYLYCTEIRTRLRIETRFATHPREDLESALEQLVARDLMFREDDRYLSLAIAQLPHLAARRIRTLHEADVAEASERSPAPRRRLPVSDGDGASTGGAAKQATSGPTDGSP